MNKHIIYLFFIATTLFCATAYGMEEKKKDKKHDSHNKTRQGIKLGPDWKQQNGLWVFDPNMQYYNHGPLNKSHVLAASCAVINGRPYKK